MEDVTHVRMLVWVPFGQREPDHGYVLVINHVEQHWDKVEQYNEVPAMQTSIIVLEAALALI